MYASRCTRKLVLSICPVTLLLGNLVALHGQEGSKGLLPAEAGVKTNPNRKTTRRISLRTRRAFTRVSAPAGTEYGQLGITIFRVHAGQSKAVEQVGDEQMIERLDTNAAYTVGDAIRLRIESPTAGYLYIVDQEQYSDGSFGPAVLAFPTAKHLAARRGTNFIRAWAQVEIPAYPASWRFTPRKLKEGETRKVQTAEVLTIIISPTALVDKSRLSEKQLELNRGEFERWRLQWRKPIHQQFEVENSIGERVQSKSVEEQGEEVIDNNDIGAQTIYQVAIKPGQPLMVTLPLAFKTTQ